MLLTDTKKSSWPGEGGLDLEDFCPMGHPKAALRSGYNFYGPCFPSSVSWYPVCVTETEPASTQPSSSGEEPTTSEAFSSQGLKGP